MNAIAYMMDISRFGWDGPEGAREFDRLAATLSVMRQEKIRSFRYDKGRQLSLGAGLLLDYGLRQYGLRERKVKILTGPYGKPYLADYPGIRFSLSHSGTRVMAAFSEAEIGCDVEKLAAANDKVAGRFFAAHEKAALAGCEGEAERTALFYRIWTRKESYLKMTGEGMHVPLDSFSVLSEQELSVSCIFRDFQSDGYQAAVCASLTPGTPFFCSFQILHDVV